MRFRTFAICVLSLTVPVVAAAQRPAANAANIPALMSVDFGSRSGVGPIDVLGFSWGVSNSGKMSFGSGGGEGKATFHDFNITHKADKASPVLFQGCATGTHFPQVTLTVNAQFADGSVRPALKLTLSDVLISSYSESSDGSAPVESISLSYNNITYAYVPQ